MIRPRYVIELNNFSNFSIFSYIDYFKLSTYKIRHNTFTWHQYYLHYLSVFFKFKTLTYLWRPVLVTFRLSMLLGLRQVDDELAVLLEDHTPEVFFCRRQWALGSDEGLIIPQDRVDVVGIDVWVSNVCTTLHKANTSVLEWLQQLVPVEVLSASFLVLEVLFRLGQPPQ